MAELMAIDIETYSDVSLPDCGVTVMHRLRSLKSCCLHTASMTGRLR